jgi:hypothetical protein
MNINTDRGTDTIPSTAICFIAESVGGASYLHESHLGCSISPYDLDREKRFRETKSHHAMWTRSSSHCARPPTSLTQPRRWKRPPILPWESVPEFVISPSQDLLAPRIPCFPAVSLRCRIGRSRWVRDPDCMAAGRCGETHNHGLMLDSARNCEG